MKRKNWLSQIGVLAATSIGLAALSLAGGWWVNQSTSAATPVANPSLRTQASGIDAQLVAANNRFGFKLFPEILKQNADQNIFISPSSIAIALTMAYNGAGSETQQRMAQVLELQGMSLQEVNQANSALKATLENPNPEVQLFIANSLWAKEGISFNPDFVQRIRDFYAAKVTTLDFIDPNAPSIINDWVKQSTNGKIENIIDTITPDSILFLLNAIYFKGNWTVPFPKTATKGLPFTLLDGTQKQHSMMSRRGDYPYYENDLFQAINLPYGDGRLSMYIFLPKQGVGLESFYESLNAENWEQWMNNFESKEGYIVLPRFKLEYDITLNDTLKALGMDVAFDNQLADFSEMLSISPESSTNKVKIDQVKHKTFVEVNEEGTEAAAVTGISMALLSARLDTFNIVVDRPFFCAIRDNQTETILFMGSIVEPK